MITLLLRHWKGAAIGLLVLMLGVQSWRLDNSQSAHALTKQTLQTVRGDRDQAVLTANENAASVEATNTRLEQCVASKAADVAAARREAEAAIEQREATARELQRELSALRSIYEDDADAGAWAAARVPDAVARSLRRDDP